MYNKNTGLITDWYKTTPGDINQCAMINSYGIYNIIQKTFTTYPKFTNNKGKAFNFADIFGYISRGDVENPYSLIDWSFNSNQILYSLKTYTIMYML